MQINLKDKLRSLRLQKKITQEALANHLGITPQSVGKWERGEGFPDITLLPRIAFYFDITVDELLCVDQVRVEEAIAEYERKAAVYQNNGENEKNLELWEQAYAEFPNDCRVIEGKLLQKTTDARQRENALQCLCYTYDGIDKEKALYYADMCGGFYVTREELRTTILDGEDGVESCQSYIDSLIHTAAMTALRMTSKISFSHEEKIEAFRFAIDILERLYADGNVGFYASDLSLFYSMIASEYAQMHDSQKTLDALTDSCRYAVIEANLKDMDYTAPMVNRLKYKKADTFKNYKGNACNLRLKALENRQFDFVREEDAFRKLIVMLEQNAE